MLCFWFGVSAVWQQLTATYQAALTEIERLRTVLAEAEQRADYWENVAREVAERSGTERRTTVSEEFSALREAEAIVARTWGDV